MLNVGSASVHYRTRAQPWAGALLRAFENAGGRIINSDLVGGPGVDHAGDITDPAFRRTLAGLGVRSILCTNLLQYVTEPSQVCEALVDLLPVGGYLILSVPYLYPYHVDTGFRASAMALAQLAPGTNVEAADDVECGTFARSLARDRKGALLWATRLVVPFYRFHGWKTAWARIPWFRRNFVMACVVLRKTRPDDVPAVRVD
jgi:hypothetical protein